MTRLCLWLQLAIAASEKKTAQSLFGFRSRALSCDLDPIFASRMHRIPTQTASRFGSPSAARFRSASRASARFSFQSLRISDSRTSQTSFNYGSTALDRPRHIHEHRCLSYFYMIVLQADV